MTKEERIAVLADMLEEEISDEFMQWLMESDYFVAPASTKFHGAYDGGLFDHQLQVTQSLVDLTDKVESPWQLIRSPYVVGMFHDLCKHDNYIKTHSGFIYNKSAELGHGDKSVKILKSFIDLTEEEELCIRWHMGAFDEKQNWRFYSESVKKYPNVLYTHTADMIASQIKGI